VGGASLHPDVLIPLALLTATVGVCLVDAVAAVRPVSWTPPMPVTEHVPWVPTSVDTDQRRQPELPAWNCPRRGPPVQV
jgi:hypothetical protein